MDNVREETEWSTEGKLVEFYKRYREEVTDHLNSDSRQACDPVDLWQSIMKQGRKKQGKVCPEIRMFRVRDDNNDVRGERDRFIAEQDTRKGREMSAKRAVT